MTISLLGIEFIKSFESCRLTAYKALPTEVAYTIGWGHYGVSSGTVWSQSQADSQLAKDLLKYCASVDTVDSRLRFTQTEYDAMVSFAYNCGVGNLRKLVNGRDKKTIAAYMLKYTKSGGKVINGLVRRRRREHDLFLYGTYGLSSSYSASQLVEDERTSKQLREIALEVIAGKFGNGQWRINKLREAGYNPSEVQAEVNKILKYE